VATRERLSLEILDEINRVILDYHFEQSKIVQEQEHQKEDDEKNPNEKPPAQQSDTSVEVLEEKPFTHQGKLLVDATAVPQNITYPTDLKLINSSRVKSEEIIDCLYNRILHSEHTPSTCKTNC